MTTQSPIIDLQNVSLIREDRRLLDHVSFTVREGEHWVILGPNGCGKTTLLNIITGYLWPSSGTVTILGDRYGEVDLREKRRRIGMVSSALFERVPAGERFIDVILSGKYASLGMYDKPDDSDRIRAGEIAAFLGREQIIDRPYRVLSFGERQSALIGRALMADPAILILDEPFEGLDMATREHFMERINTLIADSSGPSIIFVSHRVEEIAPGITHAMLMKSGRIVATGSKDEALTNAALYETFGIGVELVKRNGRMYAQIR